MATDSRNVSMTLSVDAIGTEGVTQLKNGIRDLAKEGADAVPEFGLLANEVEKLANQAKLTANLKSLSDEVQQLSLANDTAGVKTAELGSQLAQLKLNLDAAKAAELQLKTQVEQVKASIEEKTIATSRLRVETDDAGKKTDEYKEKVRTLKTEILDSKEALTALKVAYSDAKDATALAAAEAKTLNTSFSASNAETTKLGTALSVASESLSKVRVELEASGISAKDSATAEAALVAAWQKSATTLGELQEKHTAAKLAAEQEVAAQKEAAEAVKRAAAEVEAAANKKVAAIKYEGDRLAQEWAQEKANAKAASDAINNALAVVGVRSAESLRTEIAQVRAAFELLKSSGTLTGVHLDQAFKNTTEKVGMLQKELGTATKAGSGLNSAFSMFTGSQLLAQGLLFVAMKTAEMSKEFVGAVMAGDRLSRALNAVYKDANVANSQIDLLRKISLDSGVAVGALEQEFIKFSASMNSANIPLKTSNELFAAVTKAGASLGLTADDMAGSLNALAQMASKGVVSMEELRQQLGDRLPGAMGLAAKGLGITEAELVKLVESGDLAARDLFPALTQALLTMQGSTVGLTNDLGRFKTVLTTISEDAGAAGWAEVLSVAFRGLGAAVGGTALALEATGDTLSLFAKGSAAVVAELFGHRGAWAAYQEDVDKVDKRLEKHTKSLEDFLFPSQKVAESVKGSAVAMGEFGKNADGASAAAAKFESSSTLAAKAAELHANKTINAEAAFNQFKVAATSALEAQTKNTEALDKHAKAVKIVGDETVKLASLTGDSALEATAAATASEKYAEALAAVAKSNAEEVAILQLKLVELEKYRVAMGLTNEQIKAQKDALDTKLKSAQAEAAQSAASADAAKSEAFARGLATEKLKDHSAQIGLYVQAVENAKAKVEVYQALEAKGVNVTAELLAATKQLTSAEVMRKDAVDDLVRNTDVSLKQVSAQVTSANTLTDVRIRHLEVLKAEAERTGDVTASQRLETQIKKESITILERKRDLVEQEVAGKLKQIDAQRTLLTADTDENKAKLALLDVEEKLAKARLAGNDSINEAIKSIKDQIKAVDSLTAAYHQLGIKTPEELQGIADANAKAWDKVKNDSRTSVADLQKAFQAYADSAIAAAGDVGRAQVQAILEAEAAAKGLTVTFDQTGKAIVKAMNDGAVATKNATGYIDAFKLSAMQATAALEKQNAELEKTIAAQEKEIELKERAAELERKRKNVDKDGFELDKDGNRLVMTAENRRTVFDRAKSSGLTDKQALDIADKFIDNQGNYQGWQGTGQTWSAALIKAINDLVLQNARSKVAAEQTNAIMQASASSQAKSTSHQVTIKVGGSQQTVNLNSASDATNLTGILNQLNSAQQRSA